MTPSELMQKRYKVTAPYPDMPFEIGDILIEEDMGSTVNPFYQVGRFGLPSSPHIYYPEKYPANFKELFWWEDRKESDFPEYVKLPARLPYWNPEDKRVLKIGEEWRHDFTKGDYFGIRNKNGGGVYRTHLLPATREEYESQK